MTARCLLQADIVSQVYKAFTGRFEWWKGSIKVTQ